MDGLLFIIAIGAFIYKAVMNEKKASDDKQQKRRQPQQYRSNTQTYRTQQQSVKRNPNQLRGVEENTKAKQQELKRRLEEKYGVQSSPEEKSFQSKVADKGIILERALGNVHEEDEDIVLQENHAAVCVDYRTNPVAHSMEEHVGHSPDCETFEESDLMQHVNDLMIMGYSGNLEFERDFIAEGVDMLNRISSITT